MRILSDFGLPVSPPTAVPPGRRLRSVHRYNMLYVPRLFFFGSCLLSLLMMPTLLSAAVFNSNPSPLGVAHKTADQEHRWSQGGAQEAPQHRRRPPAGAGLGALPAREWRVRPTAKANRVLMF